MNASTRERRLCPRKGLASAVIALVLGLQSVAGFKLLCPPKSFPSLAEWRVCCSPALWPFTDYQMYNVAYGPGTVIPGYVVIGTRADGGEVTIDKAALGGSHRTWRIGLVDAMIRVATADVASYVERLRRLDRGSFRTLRLEEHSRVLVEGGALEPLPSRTLRVYGVAEDGSVRLTRGPDR